MNQLVPVASQGSRVRPQLRLVQVVHTEQISPRVRRIILGGEALAGFVTAGQANSSGSPSAALF